MAWILTPDSGSRSRWDPGHASTTPVKRQPEAPSGHDWAVDRACHNGRRCGGEECVRGTRPRAARRKPTRIAPEALIWVQFWVVGTGFEPVYDFRRTVLQA